MSVLVLGAGPVGSAVTREFLSRGHGVTVATRSGAEVAGATSVRLDAADAAALAPAARGHATIVVCTNPPYPAWRAEWPPIVESVIGAAREARADVVMVGNLYSYGRAAMPMTEHSPEIPADAKGEVRRDLWASLRAATERGDVRAVEVRASDYFGPGAGDSAHLGNRFFVPILASKRSSAIGDPDAAHSWAYLPDIATTVAAAAEHAGTWGRVWHAPAASALSRTEICRQVNERYGVSGSVTGLPPWLIAGIGAFSPTIREVSRSSYQFLSPFISDATETERELGVHATDWETALDASVAWYRSRASF
jgi:nucleoside-diphosphate-sugar epimerase